MTKKTTLKELKHQASELHQWMRDTDAFDRFGSIRPERKYQLDLLDALWAEIGKREQAGRDRAYNMRQKAWLARHS